MACRIDYNNPVTGVRHPSLVAFLISQTGVSDTDVLQNFLQIQKYEFVDGKPRWETNTPIMSPYQEQDIFSHPLVNRDTLTGKAVEYLSSVQKFYNEHGIHIDSTFDINSLVELLSYTQDLPFTFDLLVEEAEETGKKTYRLTPRVSKESTLLKFKEDVYKAVLDETQMKNSKLESGNINKFVDPLDPNIYNVVAKLLESKEVSQSTKDSLKRILPLLKLNDSIKLGFESMATEETTVNPVTGKTVSSISSGDGVYIPYLNTIFLSAYKSATYSPERFARLIIHESMHAIIYSTLNNPETSEEAKFVKELTEIFNYYQEKYSKQIQDFKKGKEVEDKFYGFQSLDEFMSEYIANKEFRDLLEEKQKETSRGIKDWLSRFIDFILSLGGRKVSPEKRVDQQYIEQLTSEIFSDFLNRSSINTILIYKESNSLYLGFKVDDLNAMDQALNSNSEFLTQLNDYLDSNSINWSKIEQEADRLGIAQNRVGRAEDLYKNIDRTEATNAFKSLTSYLHETANYLKAITTGMNSISTNPLTSLDTAFKKSYHARELGNYFEKVIEELESSLSTGLDTPFGTNTILGAQINNIKSYIAILQQNYYRKAVNAVSEKLAETIAPQTKKLQEQTQKEIERIEKELQVAGPRAVPMLKKRLQEQKLTLRKFATKQNLINAFTKELEDINTASYYLEAASMSDNLIVGSVGNFINSLFNEANIEAMEYEVKVKELANRYDAHQKSRKSAFTSLTYEEYFKKLQRKVTILEIKNGELVPVDTLVMNSEMDEIAYMNDKTSKRFEILQEEKKPLTERDQDKIDRLKQEIRQMEEEYEVLPFVAEWYAIQSKLSDEAKQAREEKIEVIRQLQTQSFDESMTEEELDLLEEAKFDLDRLESDYDVNGDLKDEQGLRIAQNIREWKKEKNAAELYTFTLSEESKELFDYQYSNNEKNYALALAKYEEAVASKDNEAIQLTLKQLQRQKQVYDLWKRANTVRTISPEWYKERRAIIDQITAIQKSKAQDSEGRTVSDAFDELFALLKGYKDQDGFYNGEKIYEDSQGVLAQKVKALQDEIDSLKDTDESSTEFSKEEVAKLQDLYSQLNEIQETVTTPYYDKVYNNRLVIERQRIIAEYASKKEPLPTESTLKLYAKRALEQTDWFKANHRRVTKWTPNGYILTNEPIFFWVKKEPKDESYITQSEPSFRWKTLQINPKYINEERKNYSKVKRVALRTDKTKYRNSAWNQLDETEKQIANETIDAYTKLQRTIPRNLRKGLELPGVQKSTFENAKVGNLVNSIRTTASNMYDSFAFKYGEDLADPQDEEGSIANKYSRRLFLKYSNRIGQDKMSTNIFNSVAQFGGEMIKFRKGYEQMAYVYGIQDVLSQNKEGTKIKKAIDNLIESRLQGKTRKTLGKNKVLNFVEEAVDASLSIGATSALSFRLPSILKNQLAGTTNILFQLKGYGIDQKDLHKAGFKNMKEYANLFNAHIEDGMDTPYMLKMRYFNILPDDHVTSTGKNLFRSDLAKMAAKYNPLKHLSFLRTFGEFEMRSSVAEALAAKQYSQILLTDGRRVNILEAYEVNKGVLTPRADIADVEEFKALEVAFRGQLVAINNLIHGVYAEMDKAEYSRYTLGRILFFMKGGWLYQQTARRFGRKSVLHGGGIQYEGFYRTLLRGVTDIIKMKGNFKYVLNNMMTTQEKADFLTGVYETITTATVISLLAALNSLRYSDDDEEDQWALYQLLYTLTLLEDELSTLNPATGTASIIYSRFINNVDGMDAATYYASKEVALPFKGMWDLLKLTAGMTVGNLSDVIFDTDLGFNPLSEYVPRSRSGKVLNPKRYPQDPILSNSTEFTARVGRLIGLDATMNSVLNPEYIFRKYEERNPRWYLSTLEEDNKSYKKDINSTKKQIKAIERQMSYLEDPETREYYQESLKRLQERIEQARADRQDLNEEFFRSGLK